MRTGPRTLPLFILALALLLPAGAARASLYGNIRDGAVVGMNIGVGTAKLEFDTGGEHFETNQEAAAIGMLRLGFARSDALMVSFELNVWTRNFELTQLTIWTSLLGLSWFPGGESFWLRGGVGIGSVDATFAWITQDNRIKESGFAWGAGTGYEWRIAEEVGLGLAYDFRWIMLGDLGDRQDVNAFNHNLSVNMNYYF